MNNGGVLPEGSEQDIASRLWAERTCRIPTPREVELAIEVYQRAVSKGASSIPRTESVIKKLEEQ